MKTRATRTKSNRQILEEASGWFVDFRVDDVDARVREEFNAWLRRSPEHIQAYFEIARTYAELPEVKPGGRIDVDGLIALARASDNVVALETGAHPNPLPRAGEGTRIHRPLPLGECQGEGSSPHSRRILLAAAIVFACVASGVSTWLVWHRSPTYSTEIGEQRSVTLADGSTVNLNARSRIRIRFSEKERNVELMEGQALFDVAKDKARPFVVRTDGTLVRAVGTQFDVNRKMSGTTVTVVEGRVAVVHESTSPWSRLLTAERKETPAVPARGLDERSSNAGEPSRLPEGAGPSDAVLRGTPNSPAILLSAGEQVTVTASMVAEPMRANLAAATAWTQRRLVFESTSLLDVAEEFNRYNARPLIVEDASLADFHVSGVYSSTEPTSLLRFLRDQPNLSVNETESEIRISRK
jgi:transmembrane sensor